MKDIQRKNIDLPEKVINDLQKLAEKDKRKLKPFIELILTKYSKKAEKL